MSRDVPPSSTARPRQARAASRDVAASPSPRPSRAAGPTARRQPGNAAKDKRAPAVATHASAPTPVPDDAQALHPALRAWLTTQGITPLAFQEEAWRAQAAGSSGLIVAGTGRGKSFAALLGPLSRLMWEEPAPDAPALLVVSPLRALCRDLTHALARPIADLGLGLAWEERTGDTSAPRKRAMRHRLPPILFTTPESLALMLTHEGAETLFAPLRTVVVDEWHALMGTKRGALLELQLAHLRRLAPGLRTWGMSATVADPDAALRALVPQGPRALVHEASLPRLRFAVLRPPALDDLPLAGHFGLAMAPAVLEALDPRRSTLIFTNTRAQAEAWHGALVALKPAWEAKFGLHHGSLSAAARQAVEDGVKDGTLPFVVCTSSLELGVDLPRVDRVFHVGSPKGLGRLRQRAGRAAHRPDGLPEITLVPTHALQILEHVSLMSLEAENRIEPTPALAPPLDVLCQHLVNRALGDGYAPDRLFAEVTAGSAAFASLPREAFDQALRFVSQGGEALSAYPQYRKVAPTDAGTWRVTDARVAQLQRMNVGTILAEASVTVAFLGGKALGHVEESFASRLSPGDVFAFAGHNLAMIKLHENTLYVRASPKRPRELPRWMGSRLPYSPFLTAAIRATLGRAAVHGKRAALPGIPALRDPVNGALAAELLDALAPLMARQKAMSALPAPGELLVECVDGPDGRHAFLFPFAGFALNEATALVVALRLARRKPATFAIAANDWGFALLAKPGYDFSPLRDPTFWDERRLEADAAEAMGMATLGKRHFHEIARIAGLVYPQYPGRKKTARAVQASSGLLHDVLRRFEPDHVLLRQTDAETRARVMADARLIPHWRELRAMTVLWREPEAVGPLAAPLWLERFGTRLSNEDMAARLKDMRAW